MLTHVAMDLANGQLPLDCCNLLYRRDLLFAVVNRVMRVQNIQAFFMLKDWRDSHPHHSILLHPDYPVVTGVCTITKSLSSTKSDPVRKTHI